jgi:hypothetical protein
VVTSTGQIVSGTPGTGLVVNGVTTPVTGSTTGNPATVTRGKVFISPEAMANPTEFDLFSLFGGLSRLNPFAMFFGVRTTTSTTTTTRTR